MRWILVGLLLIASSSAAAQGSPCGDREDFLRRLEEKFNEVVEHVAITGRGALVEWTVAPSGSWSMLVTIPGGLTCFVAVGQGWRDKFEDKVKLEGTRV